MVKYFKLPLLFPVLQTFSGSYSTKEMLLIMEIPKKIAAPNVPIWLHRGFVPVIRTIGCDGRARNDGQAVMRMQNWWFEGIRHDWGKGGDVLNKVDACRH